MSSPRIYLSERGHPLVYWGPPPMNQPVLTVENYLKWYSLYLVHPDGKVEKLEYDRYKHLADELPLLWGDHALYPPAYERICEELGLDADYLSWETVIGRWVSEQQDDDFGDRMKARK